MELQSGSLRYDSCTLGSLTHNWSVDTSTTHSYYSAVTGNDYNMFVVVGVPKPVHYVDSNEYFSKGSDALVYSRLRKFEL